MKKSFYLFNPGRLSRKDNTLKFTQTTEDGGPLTTKYLPIETVDNLYIFGNLDCNSPFFNFLGKEKVSVHFFDYYQHYTGSFMPRDYLLAGKMIIAQVEHFIKTTKRLVIARSLIEAAAFNMVKNLRYYYNRKKDTSVQIDRIESLMDSISDASGVDVLMGIEGNIRMSYYEAFDIILNEFEMGARTKQPPSNEINALISFLNMLCYTLCLDMIYHTQLNPTISYLHEPGVRRYSLALDLAEIFKPILVDRLIFSLINKKHIQQKDFDKDLNYCLLNDSGRRKVVQAWEEKLNETIKHRSLLKSVSYRYLVKLECYKLCKHVIGIEQFEPFKALW